VHDERTNTIKEKTKLWMKGIFQVRQINYYREKRLALCYICMGHLGSFSNTECGMSIFLSILDFWKQYYDNLIKQGKPQLRN
jgi:hypothetical protein